MGNKKKIETIILAMEISKGLIEEYNEDDKIAFFLKVNLEILRTILNEEMLDQNNK